MLLKISHWKQNSNVSKKNVPAVKILIGEV